MVQMHKLDYRAGKMTEQETSNRIFPQNCIENFETRFSFKILKNSLQINDKIPTNTLSPSAFDSKLKYYCQIFREGRHFRSLKKRIARRPYRGRFLSMIKDPLTLAPSREYHLTVLVFVKTKIPSENT